MSHDDYSLNEQPRRTKNQFSPNLESNIIQLICVNVLFISILFPHHEIMDLDLLLNQRSEYKPMDAQNCNLRAIIKTAEKMADDVGMSIDYDLRQLISNNGGTIHDITFSLFRQFEEKGILDTSIYVRKTEDFDIILHAYLHFDQTRYALAHELGHYILHAQKMSFACQKGNSRIEHEAYWFAVGFLMPKDLFLEKYEQNSDPNWLALMFRLPIPLIHSRKQSLDLQ
jgi:hypothetical protein